MTNDVAENIDFQTRMFKKIREQMGELMTDKELKSLVDTALKKAFFEERIVKDGSWNEKKLEPYFVELIRKEMEPQVKIQVAAYLKENKELVIKAMDESLAKGFYELVRQHQESMISQPLFVFADQLRQKGLML